MPDTAYEFIIVAKYADWDISGRVDYRQHCGFRDMEMSMPKCFLTYHMLMPGEVI